MSITEIENKNKLGFAETKYNSSAFVNVTDIVIAEIKQFLEVFSNLHWVIHF